MNVAKSTRQFNLTLGRVGNGNADYTNSPTNVELRNWLNARKGRAAELGSIVWPSSMGYSENTSRKGFSKLKKGERPITKTQMEELRVYMRQVEQNEMFQSMM